MSWYHTPGKEHDVVVSTRVRLARNVEDIPFTSRMDAAMAEALIARVDPLLTDGGFVKTDFQNISRTSAYTMVEKHYISPTFIKVSLPHALYLNDPCHLSVMVCEEDHLRLQCILPGFSPEEAFEGVRRMDELLDSTLDYAFDKQGRWGYLTLCPSNLGCAMRASAMLFLPVLTQSGRMEALSARLTQSGMLIRGMWGEGTAAFGYLYQISNRNTLGDSEGEILQNFIRAVKAVIEEERQLRGNIKGEALDRLSDKIWRSLGILKFARSLPLREFMELMSDVRLGAAMGILPEMGIRDLTALFIEAMPATLTTTSRLTHASDRELDMARGVLVRETLQSFPSAAPAK
ncbi:MAG: ATP--guanido phosphotransferase [Ruminococcaceae bacterium]|nr:ATP--guanido phosphotransferase [Oscillospiraceae bacterium]